MTSQIQSRMSCFLSHPLLRSYTLSEREFYISVLGCFVCGCGPWPIGAGYSLKVIILKSGASLQKALDKVAFLQSKGVVGYNKKKN